jgi:hypothetical protein
MDPSPNERKNADAWLKVLWIVRNKVAYPSFENEHFIGNARTPKTQVVVTIRCRKKPSISGEIDVKRMERRALVPGTGPST